MTVCSNCFTDPEVQGFVISFNNLGVCDFSGNEGYVIDINELYDFFQDLFNCFKSDVTGTSIQTFLSDKWNLLPNDNVSSRILEYLISELETDFESITENLVYIDDIIDSCNHWNELKESLKWTRRFISDINLLEDFGWDGFFNAQFQLSSSDILYRGRVHHESGQQAYTPSQMKCPEKEKSRGGRANPSGIPFLYLCDNIETVFYEIRASYLDEVSIAQFSIQDPESPIRIVDFTEEVSLFQPTEDISHIIKSKLLKDLISADLSKPMRRYDSEIEYIPTQFICEFILVITGALGIRFKSSLHEEGNNIVIFNQDLMHCNNVQLMKVTNINLAAEPIEP